MSRSAYFIAVLAAGVAASGSAAVADCGAIADLQAQLRCFNREAGGNDIPMPVLPDPTPKCRAMNWPQNVNLCLSKNQSGYDAAKEYWGRLSQRSAETCAHAAASYGGAALAYSALGDCVLQMYFEHDQYTKPQSDFRRD